MATRIQQSQHYTTQGSPAQGQAQGQLFTPEMRDRQARGKDPYYYVEEAGGDDLDARMRSGRGLPMETYEERERKEFAMAVLDDPETLLMHAQAQNDSVAGQRLRFLRMLCPASQQEPKSASKPTHGHSHGQGQSRKYFGGQDPDQVGHVVATAEEMFRLKFKTADEKAAELEAKSAAEKAGA